MKNNKKTTTAYWDSLYAGQTEPALSSKLSVGSKNLQRLFRRYIRPGMRFLEIGCAPGKQLAYIGKYLKASVAGLDYSPNGIELTRRLFDKLGLKGDLRCEDIFETTFQPQSFDVVYSLGVVEHFHDPTDVVRQHVELVKPAGMALILVPNYGGIYGHLQAHFDPANLSIHNTAIMKPANMQKLAPADLSADTESFPYGRISPWLLNLNNKWPKTFAQMVNYCVNFVGLLQTVDIEALCPLIVLRIIRA